MSSHVSAAKKSSLPWHILKTWEFSQSIQPLIPTAVHGLTTISTGWWISHILPNSWLRSALSSLKIPINSKNISTKIRCVEVLCWPWELLKGPIITPYPARPSLVLLQHLFPSLILQRVRKVGRFDLGCPKERWGLYDICPSQQIIQPDHPGRTQSF